MVVAAPAYQTTGTSTGVASAASVAAPVPSGVAANDVVLVWLYKESTTTVTTLPTGFALVGTSPSATGSGAHTLHCFRKRATGADAGTYTFSWVGAVNCEAVAARFSGCSTSLEPVSTSIGAGSTSSSTNTPSLSVASSSTGRTVIYAASQFTSGNFTPPTGMTEIVDTGAKLGVSYLTNTGVPSLAEGRTAAGTNSAHCGFALLLRPEPAAPTVGAGADASVEAGYAFTRTGTEDDGASALTSRAWTVVSGPASVGSTLATTAALSWTPYTAGTYVLRFTGTNAIGSGTDDLTLTVTAATAFLQRTLTAGALWVEAAWGADLSADPTTWVWSDITADVRQSDGHGIEITIGRADEASETQPAQCTFLLDNSTGAYGLGGQSVNWPYVRRNTPIRVRVFCSPFSAAISRFEGYAVGWAPDWDTTGRDATVVLTAAGELRRLAQNTAPPVSPYRRAVLADAATSGVVAYWPCEDAGTVTGGFSPAIGSTPLLWNDDFPSPKPAANSDFLCSDPLPTIANAELYGAVPRYTSTGVVQARMLVAFPDSGIADGQPILLVDVSGSTNWWLVRYATGGQLNVRVLNSSGTELENTNFTFDVDGRTLLLDLAMAQNGGNVDYTITVVEQGATSGATAGGSCAGTLGAAQAVWVNTFTDQVDDGIAPAEVITPASASLVVGHITVGKTQQSVFSNLTEFNAYTGEIAYDRLVRVAEENGIRLSAYDDNQPAWPQITDLMGPQIPGDTLAVLREGEQVDKGVLFDGVQFGLTYYGRRAGQSLDAVLTLDVDEGHLLPPFSPVDDDQGQANEVTVQVRAGGQVTATDTDGPLGTAAIGLYASQVTLNINSEDAAVQHAAWHVRHGTVEGYRYPELVFSVAKSPDLAAGWLATLISDRVDVTNLLNARTQFPTGDVSFRLLGYTETITQVSWDVVLNVAPYDPWRIVEVGASASDTGEFVPHLDTQGATLNSSAAVGATSLSVATSTGPIWTTDSNAYPMVLDVGGIPVTATACSGGSSPQTFTVTGSTVTTAKTAGTRVQVWQPPELGL